jgi:pimeloyl-ACP methyl ester carboxylesterase
MSGRTRCCLLAALLALASALGLAGCVSPQGSEAAELLADIAAGAGPSRLKQTTPAPSRVTIRYAGAAGPEIADLYREPSKARGAVVVVPGLTPYGKDDPRLVAFAQSLARARFFVLVPDIPGLRALKVSAADSAFIADAIDEAAQRFARKGRRLGLVAISYAVGPALLAAAQTPAGRAVGYIVTIGGYYDIDAAIAFATTGYYRLPDGTWRHVAPNDFGKWVLLRSNADQVANAADRALLYRIAERRLADPAAGIEGLVARLGPQGRAVYALIANRNPRRVPSLVAQLPAALRRELQRLNLKEQNLRAIAGPVFIIHGRDDAVIPYTQSVALAAALGGRAHLYLVDHFAHVGGASLGDNLRLWQAATAILTQRDRLAGTP